MPNTLKNKSLSLIILLSTCVLLAMLLFDSFLNNRTRLRAQELTEDQVMQLCPDYFLTLPQNENPTLVTDINSTCFNDGDNGLYIILPQCADESNVVCYVRDTVSGAYFNRLVLDLTTEQSFAGRTIKAVKLSLPIAYVSIDNTKLSYAEMIASNDKSNICQGDVIFTTNNGEKDDLRKHSIHLAMRGAGYQFNDKKSLTLSFDKKAELLGMGEQKKYNLISNNYDPSLLKSELFFKMAEDFGMDYTPKAENISLFIDGNYSGVYTLTTKVSVGKNKINIGKNDYLINFGGTNPVNPVFYDSETYFIDGDIEDPYFDLVYPENVVDTSEIKQAVQNFISTTEDISDDTYTEYFDLDDMIKYYWVQEISMNYDACFRSTYAIYNHSDKKIHMGPIWDMDLTLGSNFEKEGIMFNTPDGYRIRNMSWYPRLFARDKFKKAVIDKYVSDDYSKKLHNLSKYMTSRKQEMSTDGEMNYRLYRSISLDNILQERTWTYDEFADSIINFYNQRIDWIDSNLYE